MPECPEGFQWYKDAYRASGGVCRDIAKERARHARYQSSEKGREKHLVALGRWRAKRNADPLRRIHYLNHHAQRTRRQRIADLEQQLKEL